ncbi:hypothetical protein [Nonomuraea wenchangensis]|uniref:hypothetical protein n=1 Tax=Nonomuraea wenchangensis TaxID=568860 RepID=UPI00332417A1
MTIYDGAKSTRWSWRCTEGSVRRLDGAQACSHAFKADYGHGGDGGQAPLIPDDPLHYAQRSWRSAGKILAVGLIAWWLPVAAVALLAGIDSVFTTQGLVLLRHCADHLRRRLRCAGLRRPARSRDIRLAESGGDGPSLALAETTPGPLIMMVQFVAFLVASNQPGTVLSQCAI